MLFVEIQIKVEWRIDKSCHDDKQFLNSIIRTKDTIELGKSLVDNENKCIFDICSITLEHAISESYNDACMTSSRMFVK